jgi:flagellin
MTETEGVLKTASRDWLFPENYDWAKGSYKAAGDDREVAVIREHLLGNIADVRLSAHDANAAISTVQTFEHAANSIYDKLVLMEEAAEKAVNGDYTTTEKVSMQEQLQEWAEQINNTVNNTEYNGNKLFTSEGQVITSAIGNGRSIHLFAKNLSFSLENVDLTKDAKAALTTIQNARTKTGEYTDYIKSQSTLLQDAMATIEQNMASAIGLKSSDFEIEPMQQFVENLSAGISNDKAISTEMQANITPDEALHLLRY